jgi:VWFA-related protein
MVEVRVINLEIRAFDRAGRPIEDLRADELSLRVDGRPIPIRYFARFPAATAATAEPSSSATASTTATDATPAAPADPVQRVIVFIDHNFLGPASRARAVAAIRGFLEQLPAESEILLATFDRSGLSVRVPFTRHRKEILQVLDDLPLSALDGFRRDADRRAAIETIQEMQRGANPPCGRELQQFPRIYAEGEFDDVKRSLKGLRLLIDSLASTPGRKALIHVSDGLPLLAGIEAFEYLRALCDGSGARQGMPLSLDVTGNVDSQLLSVPELITAAAAYSSAQSLREVTSHANANGVTIYPLQAKGLTAVGAEPAADVRSATIESEQTTRWNSQDSLANLASETGGTASLQRNDLDVVLSNVVRDLDRYVSIGFEPPAARPETRGFAREGGAHSVEVTTTRKGVTLRYRRSYRDVDENSLVVDRLLAALYLGAADNPLAARIDRINQVNQVKHLKGQKPNAEGFTLRVIVPPGNLTLIESGGGRSGLVAIHALRLDERGLSPARRIQATVNLPTSHAGEKPFVYDIRFGATPGKAVLVVAIEDLLGRKLSVLRYPLD